MARRYYSSTAVATTLSGNINNSTTSITVAALSGYPAQTPWTAIIDPDTASEEVVTVTNVSGTTLTVTRGVDGTSAVSHNAGAVFRHGVSARDFDEANDHVNSSGDVHTQYVAKSLVSGKGSLIAATADDTPADLPVGSNGQMLMADSSATAGLRYVDPPASRNLAYNGAMQVHQRGTSVTSITSGGHFTADGWRLGFDNLGTWTQSVETDAPSGSGLVKSLKMLCTTADAAPAASDVLLLNQRLEGQNVQSIRKGTASAQQLSASFWVKSNVTGTYIVEIFDNDNARNVSASYTVSASATWERKTITFPADTTGVLDNDNGHSLRIVFWLAAGSNFTSGTLNTAWASASNANTAVGQTNLAAATNNYWQITGVQLETGPVATPFEFEPYEATLRKCQRYYYRVDVAAGSRSGAGYNTSALASAVLIPLPVLMRVAPTALEQSGTAGDYAVQHGNYTITNCSSVPTVLSGATRNNGGVILTVASGLTAGQGCLAYANNTSAYFAWSAEL